jgi:ChaB protein
MAKKDETEKMREEVPSTIARSDDKAVRTFKKTLDSAAESYGGDGERARRAAFASLKHTHEKVGDHWEPKDEPGPSDPQAAKGGADARDSDRPTAQGVDANARKGHLEDVAKKVGIEHPEKLKKADLVDEIRKANDRETRKAREREK